MPLDPTTYTPWGYLGALVFLVVAFGYYLYKRDQAHSQFIKERDAQWQTFYKEQRAVDNQVITDLMVDVKGLTQELVALRSDFNEHNTWERAKLEALTKPARGKTNG